MKKMFAIMIGLMLITSAAFAGGSSSSVPTRYPVVLIHGIAMSDINILGVDYFYGVKSTSEALPEAARKHRPAARTHPAGTPAAVRKPSVSGAASTAPSPGSIHRFPLALQIDRAISPAASRHRPPAGRSCSVESRHNAPPFRC